MKKLIILITAFFAFQFASAQVPDIFPDGIILGSFANDPTGYRAGQLYYNTTDSQVKFYNGAVWSALGAVSIPTIQEVLTEGNEVTAGTELIFNGAFSGDTRLGSDGGSAYSLSDIAFQYRNVGNTRRVSLQPSTVGIYSNIDFSSATLGTLSPSDDEKIYAQRKYVDDAIANTIPEPITTASTNYILLEADIKAWTPYNFTGDNITITIPAITYEDFIVLNMQHTGTGTVTIEAGAGVTFPDQTFTTDKAFSIASYADDVWGIYSLEVEGGSSTDTFADVTARGATTTSNITTQGYTSTGTRADGDLVVTIGDKNNDSSGFVNQFDIDNAWNFIGSIVSGFGFYTSETEIRKANLLGNFTYVFPDASGTLALTTGSTTYSATSTTTTNLDLDVIGDSHYQIVTTNTNFTFTNTPAVGETFVKSLEVISTAGETITFSTADKVIGTFVNDDSTVNTIVINFANYPTIGLRITVLISQ